MTNKHQHRPTENMTHKTNKSVWNMDVRISTLKSKTELYQCQDPDAQSARQTGEHIAQRTKLHIYTKTKDNTEHECQDPDRESLSAFTPGLLTKTDTKTKIKTIKNICTTWNKNFLFLSLV